jgi:hypothetical protein
MQRINFTSQCIKGPSFEIILREKEQSEEEEEE